MLQLSKSKAAFRTAAFTTQGGSLLAYEVSVHLDPTDGPVALRLIGATITSREQIGELIGVLEFFRTHGRLPVPPPPVRVPFHDPVNIYSAEYQSAGRR
ncbi:MAG: hypothetical protein U0871_01405 [Gemmataceae bacterium]